MLICLKGLLHQQGRTLGVFDEALAHTSLQMCARGGEPGTRDGGTFEPARGFVWTDIEWRTAAESQSTFPSVDVWWYPAKDGKGTHRKVPIPVSRKHLGPRGADPTCPYDAIWALWDARAHTVPERARGTSTPFFRADDRKIVTTAYVAVLGQTWAYM